MVHPTSNIGVLLQSEAICQDAKIPVLPHVWRKPNSNTYCLSEDQPTLSKWSIRIPPPCLRWSTSSSLIRQQMLQRITNKFELFQIGDKVWLESRNLKLRYKSWKLALKQEGPFKIQKVLGPLTYQLELLKQWKIHPVFYATLLSPYKENDIYGNNFTHPSPDLIDGQEEYEVEAILSHKWLGRRYAYLIKWKGYSSSDNSWEPEWNIVNAPELLSPYKQQHWLK